VCNNLPAVLVLLPLTAASGAGAVLAVLLGVNIGPNLTYTGSLATPLRPPGLSWIMPPVRSCWSGRRRRRMSVPFPRRHIASSSTSTCG
jgi:hypothetical protein